jgi:hypothetical protein
MTREEPTMGKTRIIIEQSEDEAADPPDELRARLEVDEVGDLGLYLNDQLVFRVYTSCGPSDGLKNQAQAFTSTLRRVGCSFNEATPT